MLFASQVSLTYKVLIFIDISQTRSVLVFLRVIFLKHGARCGQRKLASDMPGLLFYIADQPCQWALAEGSICKIESEMIISPSPLIIGAIDKGDLDAWLARGLQQWPLGSWFVMSPVGIGAIQVKAKTSIPEHDPSCTGNVPKLSTHKR